MSSDLKDGKGCSLWDSEVTPWTNLSQLMKYGTIRNTEMKFFSQGLEIICVFLV